MRTDQRARFQRVDGEIYLNAQDMSDAFRLLAEKYRQDGVERPEDAQYFEFAGKVLLRQVEMLEFVIMSHREDLMGVFDAVEEEKL